VRALYFTVTYTTLASGQMQKKTNKKKQKKTKQNKKQTNKIKNKQKQASKKTKSKNKKIQKKTVQIRQLGQCFRILTFDPPARRPTLFKMGVGKTMPFITLYLFCQKFRKRLNF
jgi:hypothetical protein